MKPHICCCFLHCRERSESWSCNAILEFRLYSHSPTKTSYLRKFNFVFNSSNANRGYPKFIEWNEVLKEENGYVKDGTITIEVNLNTDYNNTIKTNVSGECFSTILENKIANLKKQLKQEQKKNRYLEKEHEDLAIKLVDEKIDVEYYKSKDTERIKTLKSTAELFEELFFKEKFEKQEIEKQYKELTESLESNSDDLEVIQKSDSTKIKLLKEKFDEAEKQIWKEKAENRKLRRENEDLLETQKYLKRENDILRKKLERSSTQPTSIKNLKQSNSTDEDSSSDSAHEDGDDLSTEECGDK